MREWPSTTQILRHHGLYRNYEEWGNRDVLKRGSLVNWGCHLMASGLPLDVPGEEPGAWRARHTECDGFLHAYQKFLSEHRFEIAEYEREYRHPTLRFISHPDQLGRLDDAGLVVLELKTGSMPKCCPLQTAGQALAIRASQPKTRLRRFALLLTAEGHYRLFPHDDYRDLDRFRSLVDAWWTAYDFGGIDNGITE